MSHSQSILSKIVLTGSNASIAHTLTIAGDTLGELLDKQQGHTVTDKDIYRYSLQLQQRLTAYLQEIKTCNL